MIDNFLRKPVKTNDNNYCILHLLYLHQVLLLPEVALFQI
jgi:hypothetical protein